MKHAYGKGTVIYFASGLLDIYHRLEGKDESSALDRYRMLKFFERQNGIQDNGWIFDITLDNLQQVTGTIDVQPPPVDETIILN